MTRWKLTIEYDGKDYYGWQKQPALPSVQETLGQAIEKFCGEAVTVHAAGRTDTGVHARAQVGHVDIIRQTTGETLRDAVNSYLRPHKIAVLKAEQVDKTFHARFSASARSYRYTIVNRRAHLTIQADHAWHVISPLDSEAMQMAAKHLLGTHDFSTFRAKDFQAKSPIKTLEQLDVVREGDTITIHATARSFLYHQVRNMVGTLSLVGKGKWSQQEFIDAFAARNRAKGGPTAPAQGLCFWGVVYPQK